MIKRLKYGLFKIATAFGRIGNPSLYFFSSIPQFFNSSRKLKYVSKGYCATSVNTSIFRKSSVISNGDDQYISFYNRRGKVVVGKRKLTGRRWKLRVTDFMGNISDAHNGISLGIDGDGYLHLAFGMHGSKLKYARSLKPRSLKFTSFMPMTGEGEEKVTYPEFHTMSNGDLLFFYRNGVSGNGNLAIKRYLLKEKRWKTIQLNLIDGEGQRNAYWQTWVDTDDNIFISWIWRENSDVSSNHDLCFACSNDGGLTWRKTDGEIYELPITSKNAEKAWDVSTNSDLINQTSITVDDKGMPYISTYWRDKNNDVPQYRIIWHNGSKWQMKTVGKRSEPFTLKGIGTKMIPASRPLVIQKGGNLFIIFRDKERGGKPILAKAENLNFDDWQFHDLSEFDVDAWEPSFDENLWKQKKELHLFLQSTHQGDGEKVAITKRKSTPVYILQVDLDCDME